MSASLPPRDLAQIFGSVCKEYGLPNFPSKSGPGSLNEPFWAAFYRKEHDCLYEPRERAFYEYEGDIYREITAHVILNRLADRLREAALASSRPDLARLTASRHINGVIAHLKGQIQKEEAFENRSGLIHVENGVLNFGNGEIVLQDFSPDLVSRNIIPIPYEPGATCPRFRKELLGLLNDEDRVLLQKFMGLFLLGRNVVHKMLILHGLGETGKSTFSEVARKLIGVVNCSELRTHLLHERFEIGSFLGKHLLIGADVSSTFLNSRGASRLKAIVGGDLLDAERKGANLRFQIPGNFNVMVTSNSRLTAHLENDRGPWARRLAIVEYEKPRTAKIIPEFAEQLIREEGPGILLFATEGLQKLWADIDEHGTLMLTEKQRARVASLLDESDGVRLFLQDCVHRDPSSALTTSQIVEAYAAYAMSKGWNMSTRETEQQLTDLMLEMFQVGKSHNVPSAGSKSGVRGYRGVAFIY